MCIYSEQNKILYPYGGAFGDIIIPNEDSYHVTLPSKFTLFGTIYQDVHVSTNTHTYIN